jgi:hypothetical protein
MIPHAALVTALPSACDIILGCNQSQENKTRSFLGTVACGRNNSRPANLTLEKHDAPDERPPARAPKPAHYNVFVGKNSLRIFALSMQNNFAYVP